MHAIAKGLQGATDFLCFLLALTKAPDHVFPIPRPGHCSEAGKTHFFLAGLTRWWRRWRIACGRSLGRSAPFGHQVECSVCGACGKYQGARRDHLSWLPGTQRVANLVYSAPRIIPSRSFFIRQRSLHPTDNTGTNACGALANAPVCISSQ